MNINRYMYRILGVMLLAGGSHIAAAQPAGWVQGIWKGTCTRGARSANAQLVLAYSTATQATTGTLNGHALSALRLIGKSITFTERQKTFEGTFGSDFNTLSAQIDKGPRSAQCTMTRAFKESDSLCLYDNTGSDQFIWLDSPNGQGGNATFILRVEQRLEITGDKSGRLCSSRTDFVPPVCPTQIAQKYYSCQ